MSEIRAALIQDVDYTASPGPSGEIVELLTFAKKNHKELNPRNNQEVELVDIHCDSVSFALPADFLDKLREAHLSGRGYLNISGIDVNGAKQSYSFKIDDKMISQFAYNTFLVLATVKGEDFLRAHFADWPRWMR